jgi:hypothetical protein
LLAALAVVAGVALALSRFVRSTSRRSGRETLTALAPYGTGVALTLGVVRFHDPFLSTLTGRIERRIPAQLLGPFREVRSEALSAYGGELLALAVMTALLVVSLAVVAFVMLVMAVGMVDSHAAGTSVAAAGLFTVATFATVLGASLSLALVGALASLVVWDVGDFGGTLGMELGSRTRTVRAELVHGGATLLVGVGTVGVVLASARIDTAVDAGSSAGVVALVGAVVATLLLVVASR